MVALDALALTLVLCSAGETVLLEFSADWCGPCRSMEPAVQRLAGEGYPIRKINVDQDPQSASRFRVTGVPCFVMLVGGQEVDRVVGAASYARLVQMFSSAQNPLSESQGQVAGSRSEFGPPAYVDQESPGTRDSSPSTDGAPTEGISRDTSNIPEIPAWQRAMQATVRIRVEDADGHSLGTGTVIDSHGNESLVVTCGHIFRASAGKGRILVDLFTGAEPRSLDGQLVSYDLARDVGFVSFVHGAELSPVRVAPAGHPISRGSPVFSVGCDRGGEPRVQESRITAIDKYLGPPNVEVAGQPVDGRSGGGLFSSDGYLIGVCNAADPADNEGIFAALPAIHWELDRIGQRDVYEPTPIQAVVATNGPGGERNAHGVAAPPHAPDGLFPSEYPEIKETLSPDDTEVICIVRSRAGPGTDGQLFVLERPSRELLDYLARQSRREDAPAQVALQAVQGLPHSTAWPGPGFRQEGRAGVVRAQSAGR